MTILSFADYMSSSPADRHGFFMRTLSRTNRTPEYYVNWEKVQRETKRFELELNTLNFLVGKPNIRSEAIKLFTAQPNLLKAIPALIASREDVLDVLTIDGLDSMSFYQLDFRNIDSSRINDYIDFVEETGLLQFLQEGVSHSLVDYVYGVEAGLDSNARKNRSGSTMEGIVSRFVQSAAEDLGYSRITQVSASTARSKWNIDIPVDKAARRFDEGVCNLNTGRAWLIETNYYGGGGSKLKSVAGEFMTLSSLLSSGRTDLTFVWVTDGQGWNTAAIPLSEAFESIPAIFNLEMLRRGFLKDLLKTDQPD